MSDCSSLGQGVVLIVFGGFRHSLSMRNRALHEAHTFAFHDFAQFQLLDVSHLIVIRRRHELSSLEKLLCKQHSRLRMFPLGDAHRLPLFQFLIVGW